MTENVYSLNITKSERVSVYVNKIISQMLWSGLRVQRTSKCVLYVCFGSVVKDEQGAFIGPPRQESAVNVHKNALVYSGIVADSVV